MVNKVINYIKSQNKYKKIIIYTIFILLIALIIYIPFSLAALTPIKSITITSEHTNYETKEAGSWQVKKSAVWKKKGEAEITFDVDTVMKTNNEATDIILVLDTSESMAVTKYVDGKSVSKIAQVKSDAQALTNTILANQESRIALVEFNSHASVKSDFTNNASTLNSLISNLGAYEATDYKDALVKAQDVLKGTCDVCSGNPYVPSENRELVILFLSDGYPVRETPY